MDYPIEESAYNVVVEFANGHRVFFEANDYAAFGPATNVDFA